MSQKLAKYINQTEFMGQVPSQYFDEGTNGIKVELMEATPDDIVPMIYHRAMASWDQALQPESPTREHMEDVVGTVLAGGALAHALEAVSYTFRITGVSRATTHQLVRTRVGAGFSQESSRCNDWRHKPTRVPSSIAQVSVYKQRFLELTNMAHLLYADMIDSGEVTYQDARFVLPIGTESTIFCQYTFPALKGVLGNRLCNNMQWEINYVAKLMMVQVREVHPLLKDHLGAWCDFKGECTHSDNLYPPCDRHPHPEWMDEVEYVERKDLNYWETPDGLPEGY